MKTKISLVIMTLFIFQWSFANEKEENTSSLPAFTSCAAATGFIAGHGGSKQA